jgi:hypothetical protein
MPFFLPDIPDSSNCLNHENIADSFQKRVAAQR